MHFRQKVKPVGLLQAKKQSQLTICCLLRVRRETASETSSEADWLLLPALPIISNYLIISSNASLNSSLFSLQSGSLLQRSKSFCQTEIEKLLDGEDGSNALIGDFTKVRTMAVLCTLITSLC